MNNFSNYQNVRLFKQPCDDDHSKSGFKALRKVKKQDTFPCFSCFDNQQQRNNCQACNKLGFIYGDHPMVNFIQDFLQKNLPQNLDFKPHQNQTSSKTNSDYSGNPNFQQPDLLISNLPRKQCRSALQHSPQFFPHNEIPQKLLKSSNPSSFKQKNKNKGQIHSNFKCNICNQYIRGKRYHCLECQDYDLCQQCLDNDDSQQQWEQAEGEGQGTHKREHKMDVIEKRNPEDVVKEIVRSGGFGRR